MNDEQRQAEANLWGRPLSTGMTVEEARKKAAELTDRMECLIREYERVTGCRVHGVSLTREHTLDETFGQINLHFDVGLS